MNFLTEQYVKMMNALAALKNDEKGASLVEYALLLVLIAIVCIVAITLVGQKACEAFSKVGSSMS